MTRERSKTARSSKALSKHESKPTNIIGWSFDGMSDEQKAEAATIQLHLQSKSARPKIEMQGGEKGRVMIVGSGSDANKTLHSMRLCDALGTKSISYVEDFLRRLTESLRLTGNDDEDSNITSAAIGMVAAVAPRNELEATMALQMVAANEAALMCFTRSRRAELLEHAIAYSNMANKAMRSFALQAEALAKMRRGGEQVVRHVHVSEGGQAVSAGTVNTGAGKNG